MNILYLITTAIVLIAVINLILLGFIFRTKKLEVIKFILIAFLFFLGGVIASKYITYHSWVIIFCIDLVISSVIYVYFLFWKKEQDDGNKKSIYKITLETDKGNIIFRNPFNGFLIYGGAEAGKTSSIGKPLLKEYMRNNFALFIYDAKENDYTLTALKIKEEINYPYPIYNLDFYNAKKSFRTNPFSKKVIKDEILLPVFAEIFFSSFMRDDERKDEWFEMSLGIFKAVAYVFYKHHEKYCTLPHICNFIQHSDAEKLGEFIQKDDVAKNYASAFFNSGGSEKTLASILTNLGKNIANFSANKNVCYVLSGDDFEYTPLDPEFPKTICVSNNFQAREVISPLVVLLFVAIAKQIKFGNKIPYCFFLDEATTFKIPDLESYPSELREYLVAFVMLTQSAGKLEKKYSKYDRSSLESNLANQFYGWTADIIALENYAKQFSRIDEKHQSYTRSENKKSTTTSSRKEIRYDGEFFGSLKAGEFVGKAKNSNVTRFHKRFKQYTGGKKDDVTIPREVTDEDIENNYKRIVSEVKNIY